MMRQPDPVVSMSGITKLFPGVVALDRVSFDLFPGEIHSLLGENGAGKTTLMNVLFGLYAPDRGEVRVRGETVHFSCPRDAIARRMGMVHQHFKLVPPLTVVENVILGSRSTAGPWRLDLRSAASRIRELSDQYRLDVDPDAPIWQLSVGARQRVEIIKALYRGAEVLILDEPTAVLTPQEARDLFRVLREIVSAGGSVVFISHKMWEVLSISDRISVLRGGTNVSTVKADTVDRSELARLMVGRDVVDQWELPVCPIGPAALDISGLRARNDKGLEALHGLDLKVAAGEIVGVAGVDGNGQRELAETIAGLRPASGGRVFIGGVEVTARPPKGRINAGLGYVPEDRQHTGLVLDFSIRENMVLRCFDRPPYGRRGWLNDQAIQALGDAAVAEYAVKAPGSAAVVRTLSGGNQQKVVMAREITMQPKALIVSQPTRGLDLGATSFVRQRLIDERVRGAGVLLISSDLDEVLAISDRVVVLYNGRIMAEFRPGGVPRETIGLWMAGVDHQPEDDRPLPQPA